MARELVLFLQPQNRCIFLSSMIALYLSLWLSTVLLLSSPVAALQPQSFARMLARPNVTLNPEFLSQALLSAPSLLRMTTGNPDFDSCMARVSTAFNHFLQDPTLASLLSNSGKGIGDMGNYVACGSNGSPEYYLQIMLPLGAAFSISLPLCLPRECPLSLLLQTRPFFAQLLKSFLGVDVTPEMIIMFSPKAMNESLSETTPGVVIFCSVLLLFFLAAVGATVADRFGLLEPAKSELPDSPRPAVWQRLISCFSMQRNMKSLMNTENRVDPKLEVLNGVRVLSIGWVVLGHAFVMYMYVPLYNMLDIQDAMFNTYYMGLVKAGTVAVDVFFFLSGFLATLAYCRGFANPKNRTVVNVLLSYFHRYVRLLPFMGFCIAFTVYVLPKLNDTPLNFWNEAAASGCRSQWLPTLLYVNNFVNDFEKLCIGWVWYLFIDMQLFIITPCFILLYLMNKKLGLLAMLGICIASIITVTVLCIYYNFNLSMIRINPEHDSGNIIYMQPHCRLMPYFMGMILYLVYDEGKNEMHGVSAFVGLRHIVCSRRVIRYVLYICGLVLMTVLCYSFYYLDKYPESWGKAFGVFHMVTVRPAFILGLCMIIYPVLAGKGTVLLSVLGHKLFNPLGKLTYGTYMLHIILMYYHMSSMLQGRFYTGFDAAVSACAMFLLSYLGSLVVTLILESPVAMILKNFLEAGRRPATTKPAIETSEQKLAKTTTE